jgi:hypothetical protein
MTARLEAKMDAFQEKMDDGKGSMSTTKRWWTYCMYV